MTAGKLAVATTVHVDRSPAPIPADEVHLWLLPTAPLNAEPLLALDPRVGPWSYEAAERQRRATTEAERTRASRLQRVGSTSQFLVAHGALRLVLADLLDCDPTDVMFEEGTYGKPQLAGTPLHFNLSHSGSLAAIAVSSVRPVGVDVERRRPLTDLPALVRRVCSPRERDLLYALPLADRPGAFLAMWTCKEALAKCSGEGLRALHRDTGLAELDGYRLVALEDIPGYAAAVAAEGSDWRLIRR